VGGRDHSGRCNVVARHRRSHGEAFGGRCERRHVRGDSPFRRDVRTCRTAWHAALRAPGSPRDAGRHAFSRDGGDSGSRIRIESPDGRREWSLAAQPVALAWIEAIRASLAGDVATLARLFRITLTGTSASWRLHLEPLDARVATTLAHVEVRGREAQLSTIEIVDRQGDRVVIKLEPVQRRPQ